MTRYTRPIAFVLAFVDLAVAGAAVARDVTEVPLASATLAALEGQGGAARKICLRTEPVTGSIMSGTFCKTRADWEAEGVVFTARHR